MGFSKVSKVKRMHALRRQAHELMSRGATHADIAAELGVTRVTVWKWSKHAPEACPARGGDMQALRATHLERIACVIEGGAQAYGFASADWTNARLTAMMEIEFDLRLTSIQTFHLLGDLVSGPDRPAFR